MTDDQPDLPDGIAETDEFTEDGFADDGFADDCGPAADGILRCLQMLAEEATVLRLPHTLETLRQAMTVCAAEVGDIEDDQSRRADGARPAVPTLH